MSWWLLRLINGKIFTILRLTVNFFLLFWLFCCHDKLISPLSLCDILTTPPPQPFIASQFFYTLLSTLCWRRLTPAVPIDIYVISPESYTPLRWRLVSKGYREKIEVYSGDTRLRQELLITTTRHNKSLIQLCCHRSLNIFFNQFFLPLIRLIDILR